ncbi:MAG TPA: putative Ig domain-containing protein [Woeseiaceae bacterium]|nr:putative Ig domain-containing protein [Woeseiaceae bacterium]
MVFYAPGSSFRTIHLFIFLVIFLGACGGSGGGSGNSPAVVAGTPTISGIPDPAIPVGEEFSFQPEASDAEGDELSFAIENKPEWASFDTESGTLAGTPQPEHVGEYRNIKISVSDGSNVAAISISLQVVAEGNASVSLTWTAPTHYEDGTVLSDLAGYFLYYGDEEGHYPRKIHIDNASVSTFVVDKLMEKTYYFVATAYNSNGRESRHSNVAVKTAR